MAAQFTVDVTDYGSGQVLFTLYNAGPIASSVTEIYFDDGTLLGIATIINPVGVSFDQGSGGNINPPNLPGGATVMPVFVADFGSEASGNTSTGVNPGESVGIVFDLINGSAYADTLAALEDGSLRIGLHVRSIGSEGQSDSFVTGEPGNPVPDAATTVMLLGMALLGVEGARRRFTR